MRIEDKMKDYRDKELKYLLFILIFLFLIWCTPILEVKPLTGKNSMLEALSNAIESVIISGILSLGVFLCDCSISSKSKDKLVGLFIIPRPGETIFSRIKNGVFVDDRFLVEDAKNKYSDIISNLPTEKKQSGILRMQNGTKYIYFIRKKKRSNKVKKILSFVETYLLKLFFSFYYIVYLLSFFRN